MKKMFLLMGVFFFISMYAQAFSSFTYRSPFENNLIVPASSGTASKATYLAPTMGFTGIIGLGPRLTETLFEIGLDSKWVLKGGFTVWFNNTLNFGLSSIVEYEHNSYDPYGSQSYIHEGFSFEYITDTLIGYTFQFGKSLIGLGTGLQIVAGMSLVAVNAAFHVDYAYMISRTVGIQTSITDGIGFSFLEPAGLINTISTRIACIIKL